MSSPSTQSLPFLATMAANQWPTSRPLNLTTITHYLRRLGIRRLMHNSFLRVRETATEYLEQRQTARWPLIILALIFNFAFIGATICIIIMSFHEAPQVHFMVWTVVYAVKCGVRVICLVLECQRRWNRVRVSDDEYSEATRDEISDFEREGEYVELNLDHDENVAQDHEEQTSVANHLDSADTMLSFIWWIIGFYWIYVYGQNLILDSPQLYWLCITFLIFDAFIVVSCVAMACVVGLAVCFCLPCMLEILDAVTDQEGGMNDYIQRLPKYKFQRTGGDSQNEDIQVSPSGRMIECNTNTPTEHVLPLEDAVCCICLSAYEDRKLLRRLPCHHHFHSPCIVRWLRLNPTCPLCKAYIFDYGNYTGRDQV